MHLHGYLSPGYSAFSFVKLTNRLHSVPIEPGDQYWCETAKGINTANRSTDIYSIYHPTAKSIKVHLAESTNPLDCSIITALFSYAIDALSSIC